MSIALSHATGLNLLSAALTEPVHRGVIQDAAKTLQTQHHALNAITSLIGNVEHKSGGANAARMYADMLNDIREIANAALQGAN